MPSALIAGHSNTQKTLMAVLIYFVGRLFKANEEEFKGPSPPQKKKRRVYVLTTAHVPLVKDGNGVQENSVTQ